MMTFHDLLIALKEGPIGQWMGASSWVYTVMLMFHFTGMSLLFGAMLLVDLRLLGVTKQIPIKTALAFLPVAIVGFVINLITGFCFFAFQPTLMWSNPAFKVKMALVLIAGLNALWFALIEDKKIGAMPPYGDTNIVVKFSAGLSLAIWTVVIICGRMIVGLVGLKF